MAQEELRSKIGLVPQKAVLFSGTVAENIRYGCDDASHDDVVDAAETAQAVDFIAEMTDGYESRDRPGRHQRLGRAEAAALDSARPGAQARDLPLRRQLLGPRLQDRRAPAGGAQGQDRGRHRDHRRPTRQRPSWTRIASSSSTRARSPAWARTASSIKSCEVYREIVTSQLSEAGDSMSDTASRPSSGTPLRGHGQAGRRRPRHDAPRACGPASQKPKNSKETMRRLLRPILGPHDGTHCSSSSSRSFRTVFTDRRPQADGQGDDAGSSTASWPRRGSPRSIAHAIDGFPPSDGLLLLLVAST